MVVLLFNHVNPVLKKENKETLKSEGIKKSEEFHRKKKIFIRIKKKTLKNFSQKKFLREMIE